MADEYNEYHLDAATFQKPLVELAEVISQKVKREASKMYRAPEFVWTDLHVLIRHAMTTYNLLFYLNADERRETDCYWKNSYTIAALPLVRSMIDDLYNITTIVLDPGRSGTAFRKSGFKKVFQALADEEKLHSGEKRWDEWIARGRREFEFAARQCGFDMAAVSTFPTWPTLGVYVATQKRSSLPAANYELLSTFLYGPWREYSAMAHGAFEGMLPVAAYYVEDSFSHEQRQKMEEQHPRVLSLHLARAALVLLVIVTEVQAAFRFDGANINGRIQQMWDALMPVPEVNELYKKRYRELMAERGITRLTVGAQAEG